MAAIVCRQWKMASSSTVKIADVFLCRKRKIWLLREYAKPVRFLSLDPSVYNGLHLGNDS